MRAQVGWGAGMLAAIGLGWAAYAQDVGSAPANGAPSHLRCRLFPVADLDRDREINTADRSSEVGQWVAAREAEGWRLASADFEVGQKSTGYPLAFQQVCVGR